MVKGSTYKSFVLVAGAVAWAAMSSVGVQASGVNSITQPYSLGLGDVVGAEQAEPAGFDDIACNSQNVSDACFYVDATPHFPNGQACDPDNDDNCSPGKVHIKAVDVNGFPVPMRVHYYTCIPTIPVDPNNPCVNGGSSNTNVVGLICGEGDYQIPDPAAVLIDVRVAVAGRGAIATPPTGVPPMACGQPEPVTQGTITASGTVVLNAPKAPAHSSSTLSGAIRMARLPLP